MSERRRIEFLIHRDGVEVAKAWVLRTLRIYRTAVLQNGRHGRSLHYASNSYYKKGFIDSYLALKRYYFLVSIKSCDAHISKGDE